MKVSFEMPDRAWVQLVDLAEIRSTTVGAVVAAAVHDALRPSEMAELHVKARRNMIVQLVLGGYTDREVAERTGELKGYVGDVRRSAGLPPNRVGTRHE